MLPHDCYCDATMPVTTIPHCIENLSLSKYSSDARVRLSQQEMMTRNAERLSADRSVELMAVASKLSIAMEQLGEFKQHYLTEKASRIDWERKASARGKIIRDISGKTHEEMQELTNQYMEKYKEGIDNAVEVQNKTNWKFAEDQIAKNNLKDQEALAAGN